MAQGSLLLPPGYHPLIDGAVVPSGKLAFYRTGTTTAQNTYTDSTLLVANANPVQLNATGGLDTLVYGDPATGFNYRMRVLSSADAVLDTHDDIVVPGAVTATIRENSFTGTLTGFATANPQGTVNYRIIANAAGTGKVVHLWIDAALTGTSNATSMTLTGLPAEIRPAADKYANGLTFAVDNSVNVSVRVNISTGGTITFSTGAGFSNTGFTNSGTKALQAGWSTSYPL